MDTGSNRVSSNTIDLPINDFALLAAIGPVLRQFSVVSGLHTDEAVSADALPMKMPVKMPATTSR